ncbi:hypothetical protein R69608_07648 [Paraburkholderia nemoris]|uniref:Panacea domain-containing protein n=1 Tax=Paraburkholderia nemoris TaxID=2793076 RepID=UPI00191499E4|nr:Panacea domain-containing protein [Paraburkholderia nemoris]MBK5153170.1 SocA family protein [Burkholderia sp. R-69608]CAE6971635.1 hypothetical protein R69608_07648 [Paraburkholderia nemoris]
MLISRDRERLQNAMIFFAGKANVLSKSKLFRLLYLLDFEHFRRTGRSVTGSAYEAGEMGPVPVDVARAWDDPRSDLREAIQFVKTVGHRPFVREKDVRQAFDDSHFTHRQLTLLRDLTSKYHDACHPDFQEVAVAENGAFAKTWRDGAGSHQMIPYELALSNDDPHVDEIRAAAKEASFIARRSRHARGESA